MTRAHKKNEEPADSPMFAGDREADATPQPAAAPEPEQGCEERAEAADVVSTPAPVAVLTPEQRALIERAQAHALTANGQLTVAEMRDRVALVRQIRDTVMEAGRHFDTIPGCGPKPALLKAGAEILSMAFLLCPEYEAEVIPLDDKGHREVRVTCTLRHIVSGKVVSAGVGSCSTWETKYRYRMGERSCPDCGKNTIIKGKAEYGGGWLCFGKKGGCGAKFPDGDPTIESQTVGRIENPDIADTWNTVLKQGKKRAFVDATLTAAAASELFTQDIEEIPPADRGPVTTQEFNDRVKDVKVRGGNLYVVLTFAHGEFTTPDRALAQAAKDAKTQNIPVRVRATGKDLNEIHLDPDGLPF